MDFHTDCNKNKYFEIFYAEFCIFIRKSTNKTQVYAITI